MKIKNTFIWTVLKFKMSGLKVDICLYNEMVVTYKKKLWVVIW